MKSRIKLVKEEAVVVLVVTVTTSKRGRASTQMDGVCIGRSPATEFAGVDGWLGQC